MRSTMYVGSRSGTRHKASGFPFYEESRQRLEGECSEARIASVMGVMGLTNEYPLTKEKRRRICDGAFHGGGYPLGLVR
jgi:hypothetical protein